MAKVRRKKMLAVTQAQSPVAYQMQRGYVPLMQGGYKIDRTTNGIPDTDQGGGYASADVQNGVIHSPGPLSRRDLAHEVAHIFDYRVLTDADRAKISRILKAPTDRQWYDGSGGAEFFADYYAAAAMGDQPGKARRVKGGGLRGGEGDVTYTKIGRKRLRRFRRALDEIGDREHLGYGQLEA